MDFSSSPDRGNFSDVTPQRTAANIFYGMSNRQTTTVKTATNSSKMAIDV